MAPDLRESSRVDQGLFYVSGGVMKRRAPDTHLAYLALQRALPADGCPICRLAAAAVDHYFTTLLNEAVNDPPTREVIRRAGGFCQHHAWQLLTQGDILGISIIWHDILTDHLRWMQTAGWWQRLSRRMTPCPACVCAVQDVRLNLQTLCSHLSSGSLQEAYHHSSGLCLPHLRRSLKLAPRTARAFLIAEETARLNELITQLAFVIRKHDYRFSHEPWGAADGVWTRATVKGVDTPPERLLD